MATTGTEDNSLAGKYHERWSKDIDLPLSIHAHLDLRSHTLSTKVNTKTTNNEKIDDDADNIDTGGSNSIERNSIQ